MGKGKWLKRVSMLVLIFFSSSTIVQAGGIPGGFASQNNKDLRELDKQGEAAHSGKTCTTEYNAMDQEKAQLRDGNGHREKNGTPVAQFRDTCKALMESGYSSDAVAGVGKSSGLSAQETAMGMTSNGVEGADVEEALTKAGYPAEHVKSAVPRHHREEGDREHRRGNNHNKHQRNEEKLTGRENALTRGEGHKYGLHKHDSSANQQQDQTNQTGGTDQNTNTENTTAGTTDQTGGADQNTGTGSIGTDDQTGGTDQTTTSNLPAYNSAWDTQYASQYGDMDPATLTNAAWANLSAGDVEATVACALKCIDLYAQQALETGDEGLINNVGTAYFILGQALEAAGDTAGAAEAYQTQINQFGTAQAYDPGTDSWWSVNTASQEKLQALGVDYAQKAENTAATERFDAVGRDDSI